MRDSSASKDFCLLFGASQPDAVIIRCFSGGNQNSDEVPDSTIEVLFWTCICASAEFISPGAESNSSEVF